MELFHLQGLWRSYPDVIYWLSTHGIDDKECEDWSRHLSLHGITLKYDQYVLLVREENRVKRLCSTGLDISPDLASIPGDEFSANEHRAVALSFSFSFPCQTMSCLVLSCLVSSRPLHAQPCPGLPYQTGSGHALASPVN